MRPIAAPPLRRRSKVWRLSLLAAAWLWAGGVIAFCLTYHLAEPQGVLSVSTGGHTYFGNPPALTLYQRDPVSAKIIGVALGLAVLAGTIDLAVRTVFRLTGPGVAALLAGGLLILFSLFGLLWGLGGVGTVGLLVILSGMGMNPEVPRAAAGVAPLEVPASWYPDPTGHHDLRYWDGVAWSSHVATAGRTFTDPL
ncbi:MAG TPA: DUF2510 domain-containing protein [Acidimicrobiales bacterium]|jgi:hypothetical protein|nr:DUF2510 domain-containing protein [Acidimicrobiales bacterium]